MQYCLVCRFQIPLSWMDWSHDRRRVLIKYSELSSLGYILSIRRKGEKEEEGRGGYLKWWSR
jgi:hypothetical protein